MPLPESNESQEITVISGLYPKDIRRYPETGEKYHVHNFIRMQPPEIRVEFEAVLYDIAVDFSRIKEIFPLHLCRNR